VVTAVANRQDVAYAAGHSPLMLVVRTATRWVEQQFEEGGEEAPDLRRALERLGVRPECPPAGKHRCRMQECALRDTTCGVNPA
jgi:hypothetical protein